MYQRGDFQDNCWVNQMLSGGRRVDEPHLLQVAPCLGIFIVVSWNPWRGWVKSMPPRCCLVAMTGSGVDTEANLGTWDSSTGPLWAQGLPSDQGGFFGPTSIVVPWLSCSFPGSSVLSHFALTWNFHSSDSCTLNPACMSTSWKACLWHTSSTVVLNIRCAGELLGELEGTQIAARPPLSLW